MALTAASGNVALSWMVTAVAGDDHAVLPAEPSPSTGVRPRGVVGDHVAGAQPLRHRERDAVAARAVARRLVVLMVDGVHFAEHTCVVALGIGIDGTKHPLALVTSIAADHGGRGYPSGEAHAPVQVTPGV
jgi:hypothetical protein